ncbi:hypothetical protein QF038_001611 [Pseudarthrobacter sp. W1I19]|uniref:hypothetical protein n=1 Tax=Pseudarthrobacter sp. W1I19 TaxID=3042288 RepID=UPI00277D3270|nr:hypothetical protein [Pseudarthrobacter sp. W1I19]MDQ0923103.1 hypothetical protein [Pseudarthrobacter sp. W1I19]
MGIFSKGLEQAQAAVTKAESVVTEWKGKASAAREEAARLDAESGAAILLDESAAERITLNIQAHERRARAYDQAAAEARKKLHDAQREALEMEAREEDKLAASARKESTSHAGKVADLKCQLEDLDECGWDRAAGIDVLTGRPSGQQVGKAWQLDHKAHRHETRAATIRYFLATGTIPHDFSLIDNELGTKLNADAGTSWVQGDYISKSLYAARDAGLNFAGARK